MTTATIFDLEAHDKIDLTTVLTGPLCAARLVTLAPQQSENLTAEGCEHTLFVLEGTGTARASMVAVDLIPGTAVTIPLGGALIISAGAQPMRYFHASLSVPAGSGEPPMIITTVAETVRTLSDTGAETHSRSLARRGFFFSETEAFDYRPLVPGDEISSRGRRGTEEAWFVFRGHGELIDRDGLARPLHCYTVAACPLDSGTRLRAGTEGMEALLLAVIPGHLSTVTPARLPVAS